MAESFRLSPEQYSALTTNAFQSLLIANQFTDVTLACDDGKQIEAHRVILSSCSTFFRNIFVRNSSHQHMVLYLKGIHYEDLHAIVSFIYVGETQVPHKNLDRFGLAVKDLQVESLLTAETVMYPPVDTGGNVDVKNSEQSSKAVEINDALDFIASQTYDCVTIDEEENPTAQSDEINFVSVDDETVIEASEKGSNPAIQYSCKKCDFKSDLMSSLETHCKNIHSGVRGYTCDVCKSKFRSWTLIKKHKLAKH